MNSTPLHVSSDRRGLALPMVIFAIVLLVGLIAAGFLVMGSERRASDTRDAEVRAAALAQAGLEEFNTERSTTFGFTVSPPAAYESTRVNLAGGYADVILQQVVPAIGANQAVYVIRSTGVSTRGTLSGVPQAQRTVARYARWQVGSMNVISGWTSLSGILKSGGSGTMSGTDRCGAKAPVAGIGVPTVPGYSQNGGSSVPSGSPPILDLGTQSQANAAAGIDWDAIVNGGSIPPSVTIPGDPWPSFPAGYWPVIRVDGNLSLPGDGRGILIVTGNLTMGGSVRWDGIMLVGGAINSNGNNTVAGAAISGLNALLGLPVPPSDIGSGTKTFQYDSCSIDSALTNMTGLTAVPNAWADNWTIY